MIHYSVLPELRARGERPSCRRAAQHGDDVASPHESSPRREPTVAERAGVVLSQYGNASWCVATRSQTNSSTRFGWTVGAGVEWMFAPGWIARGEYRYSDYGSFDTTFFGATVDQVNASIDLQTHTAQQGCGFTVK